jgi:GTP cyclohydrolase I
VVDKFERGHCEPLQNQAYAAAPHAAAHGVLPIGVSLDHMFGPVKMPEFKITPPGNEVTPVSETIKGRIKEAGARFFAGDNVSAFIKEGEKQALIDELTTKFEGVLDSLLIDRENDPNSKGTGRRMAKMYINELMEGRFKDAPPVTAFPNDDPASRYTGLLSVRAELKSMCSHHHQIVDGICFIGLIPSTKVIGLSKYARIAQWCARRGTLQEELTRNIADEIQKHTETDDIAVVTRLSHGCCTNRGIMARDSLTTCSVLRGQFYNPSLKEEFFRTMSGSPSNITCS